MLKGRRRAATLAVALTVCATLALFFAVHGLVSEQAQEGRLVELINNARANRGLRQLDVTGFLRDYAGYRSRVIARNGRLLPHDACGGCGEVLYVNNRGAWYAFLAFMGSPPHHAILMDPDATRIGCGLTVNAWRWWACVIRY